MELNLEDHQSQFEEEPTMIGGKDSPDEKGRRRKESDTRVGG